MQENYTDTVKGREESIKEISRFLSMSIKAIDEVFIEDGYAHRHPELLTAFMQAALFDFHATRMNEAAKQPSQGSPPACEQVLQLVSSPSPPPKDAPRRLTAPPEAGLVDVPIDLLLSVRAEPAKNGIGYTFFSAGFTSERGLAVVLNSDRLLVSRALQKGDVMLTTFFYALLVAENLAMRYQDSPLVASLQRHLILELYPQGFSPNQRFCDFATRLALSPVLAGLKDLAIYGPAPLDDPWVVKTVTFQVSSEIAGNAPWKRLSRRKRSAD